MSAEQSAHRARLLETYKLEYGDHVPFVRRQDVKGFVKRRPVWLNRMLQPQRGNGYGSGNTPILSRSQQYCYVSRRPQLLGELADAEEDHQDALVDLTKEQKKSLRPEV